jgi:hypothetical protein
MAALRRSCLLLAALGATACRSERSTVPVDAPVSLRLGIQLAFVPPEPYIEIVASFMERDGGIVFLPVTPRYVAVATRSQTRQPVAVDIVPCLVSPRVPQRIPGACDLILELRLYGNGDLLGTQTRRVVVRPGEQATVPDVVFGGGGINTTKP